MQEIKARKGKVISVITEGDETSAALSDDVMVVPEADEILAPMLSVIPLAAAGLLYRPGQRLRCG